MLQDINTLMASMKSSEEIADMSTSDLDSLIMSRWQTALRVIIGGIEEITKTLGNLVAPQLFRFERDNILIEMRYLNAVSVWQGSVWLKKGGDKFERVLNLERKFIIPGEWLKQIPPLVVEAKKIRQLNRERRAEVERNKLLSMI